MSRRFRQGTVQSRGSPRPEPAVREGLLLARIDCLIQPRPLIIWEVSWADDHGPEVSIPSTTSGRSPLPAFR